MSYDKLDWEYNVKRIKCNKTTFDIDHRVDVYHIRSRKIYGASPKKSKINKGKHCISDTLDLHSYTIDSAYYKLMDFITRNYQLCNRCLLIITGYVTTTNKVETIKNNLFKWLNDPKIQHMILYHQQATKEHGDKGAFYILLRRNKNSKP